MRTPIATLGLIAMALAGLLSAGCGALGVGSTGPNEWWLVGTTPDRGQLLVATQFGGVASGCSRWKGWDVEQTSDQVRVEAMVWHKLAPSGCTDDAAGRTRVVDLEEPLDGRELIGCQRGECAGEAWPDGTGGESPTVQAAGESVVVAGQQTVAFSSDGDLIWQREDVSANRLYAVDDVAVVSDGGRSVVALEASSGQTLWQRDGAPRGAAEGLVLQCTDDAESGLRAIEARTGTVRWSADVPCGSVAVAADNLVTVIRDPDVDGGLRLVVIALQTGLVRLDRPLDDGVDDRVAAYDDVLVADGRVIVGGAQGDLVVLEVDGSEILRLPQVRGTPIAAIGDVVVVADHRGARAVQVADGRRLWASADLTAADLEATGDMLLRVDGPAGQLERIDPQDGTAQWTADVGVTTGVDSAMLDDTLHVATILAHLRIDPDSGRIHTWTLLPRAAATDIEDSP